MCGQDGRWVVGVDELASFAAPLRLRSDFASIRAIFRAANGHVNILQMIMMIVMMIMIITCLIRRNWNGSTKDNPFNTFAVRIDSLAAIINPKFFCLVAGGQKLAEAKILKCRLVAVVFNIGQTFKNWNQSWLMIMCFLKKKPAAAWFLFRDLIAVCHLNSSQDD